MVYQWRLGSRISAPAQVAGEVCEQLEREGRLTAQDLVDVSRDENAPLHGVFEWDDSIAAEEWRKQQARCVINSIVIRSEQESVEPVRAFFKVETTGNHYESVYTIIKTPDKREMLMRQVLEEMQSLRQKYANIAEFENVWNAVDAVNVDI